MISVFRVLSWEHPKKLEREHTWKCWIAYRAWGYAVERICGYAGIIICGYMRLGDRQVQGMRLCGF